jgi:hypothetical protein
MTRDYTVYCGGGNNLVAKRKNCSSMKQLKIFYCGSKAIMLQSVIPSLLPQILFRFTKLVLTILPLNSPK